jgi:hypothetical protein
MLPALWRCGIQGPHPAGRARTPWGDPMRSLSTLVAAAALALLAVPAWSAGDQDFTLVNRTGYTIEQVYVSPIKAKDWQEDVLGRDVLDDGESVDIRFNKREEVCRWDLKVVYDDGEEAVWSDFNLCEVSRITIRYNRKSGETSADYG